MAKRKIDETPVDSIEDDNTLYASDMAPLAKDEALSSEEQGKEENTESDKAPDANNCDVKVTLVNGASFTSGGRTYKKGTVKNVTPITAEKLMKTGFFKKV